MQNDTTTPSEVCSLCLPELDVVTVIFEGGIECKFFRQELSTVSDFFNALLSGNFIEKDQNLIGLQHVKFSTFLTLLSGYKDKISWLEQSGFIDESTINNPSKLLVLKSSHLESSIVDISHGWKLVEVADMLSMQTAAAICDRYICSHMTAQSAEKNYLLANTFSRLPIVNEIIRLIATTKYNKSVDRYSTLTQKKKEDIYLTLKHKLTASTNIYLLAKNYIFKNIPIEMKQIITLEASHKRHRFSHYFYIVGGYNYNKKGNTSCWRVHTDNFVRYLQKHLSDHVKNKVSSLIPSKNYTRIFQGYRSKSANFFEKLPCFPDKDLEDYRVARVGTYIYITGGVYYDTLEAADTTWIYDTRMSLWKKGASMKHKRCHHTATTLNRFIYVCGGYDGCSVVHSSAEAYDSRNNLWLSLPDLPMGVGNAASTSHGVSIYIICGQFGVKSIQTTRKVQVFNTVTRQWSVPSEYDSPVFRPFSEYGLSCGVLGDEILMVGGQTIRVDAYNMNTQTWRRLADMQHKRIDACTLTYRGRLLVVGGYEYDTGQYFDTTEVYNIENNSWSVISCRLPIAAKNLGFCYVFDVETAIHKDSL